MCAQRTARPEGRAPRPTAGTGSAGRPQAVIPRHNPASIPTQYCLFTDTEPLKNAVNNSLRRLFPRQLKQSIRRRIKANSHSIKRLS